MANKSKNSLWCLRETHFKYNGTNRLKVNEWKRYANSKHKKVGMTILIPDKIDFKRVLPMATKDIS